jgi:hypothetical protein
MHRIAAFGGRAERKHGEIAEARTAIAQADPANVIAQ